jgi:uncharacterized protein (TIGR03437 family)
MDGESSVPTSLGGLSVTFDGEPAPILYASATQVNVQVPFAVKPYPSTVMQVSYNGSVLAKRMFAVAAQNPSVFVGAVLTDVTCGNTRITGSALAALALNEDGSVNSCANPARSGSRFTLFINGIGIAAENQNTGGFTGPNPPLDYAGSLAVFDGTYSIEADAFTDMPNAISGVGQITARVPDTVTLLQPMNLTVSLNGLPAGPLVSGSGVGVSGSPVSVLVFVAP